MEDRVKLNYKYLNTKEVGKRLREVRKNLKLTLKEMGELSGNAFTTISEMESGVIKPNTLYLSLLVSKYRVDINWILTGKGAMFLPEFDLTWDFGKNSKTIMEMFYLIEKEELVQFEMLTHFLKLKALHSEKLEKILKTKETS